MKIFTVLVFLCVTALYSCKKSSTQRTVNIDFVNIPFQASYGINVKAANGNVILATVNSESKSYQVVANQGESLTVNYGFVTANPSVDPGKLFISYNTDTLYRANGGSGQNILIKIP